MTALDMTRAIRRDGVKGRLNPRVKIIGGAPAWNSIAEENNFMKKDSEFVKMFRDKSSPSQIS